MKYIQLGRSGLQVPTIAVGCMRADSGTMDSFVRGAVELGANFFDHADIYGGGECERYFGQVLAADKSMRGKVLIQSKCGIRKGAFDFSKEHILKSVDGTLSRLCTDYLDVLLLHRPDALVEPEEVAEAFDLLHTSGKVRHFGVSNQNPMQIQLLQRYVKQPLVANQLQLSITNAAMITQGQHVNMQDEFSLNRDGSVLDFCRLNDITIQPWSPYQYGFFEGVFLDNPKFPELNCCINRLAEQYGVSNTTIVMAWLLRHPARMQPVTGTGKVERLAQCVAACDITLTRDEWYEILLAAGNVLP